MLELAGILVLGILAQWLSWRIRVPAILPLIIVGLLVGPVSSLFMPSGEKLIDINDLLSNDLLFDFISLSVGIILFEGGLSLKLKEVRELASTIRNLILIGTIITMIGGTLAAYYIMHMELRIALLFGALIIVTGPTVIKPILSNVKPNQNVNTVLKWEGVLIDPVGAFVAILIYEFIVTGLTEGQELTIHALKEFFFTVLSGVATGSGMAFIIYNLLKYKYIPSYLRNVVILGLVVLTYALSDLFHEESGLLAVTLLGMILSNTKLDQIKYILSFKEDITLILISILFILLASNITIEEIELLGFKSIIVFAVVVYAIRPLAIFISTFGSKLKMNEKLFLSWICPRGIVSAGVASIFSIRLLNNPDLAMSPSETADARLLVPLTFMVILGTVIIQGASAKWVAKKLKVLRSKPNGILFIGANENVRTIARYLQDLGLNVMLADTSRSNVADARAMNLPVYLGSLLIDGELDEVDLSDYGTMLAMTSSTEINMLGCKILKKEFGEKNIYRMVSKREVKFKELAKPENVLFRGDVDYIKLTNMFRNNAKIHRELLYNSDEMVSFINKHDGDVLPLFLQTSENRIVPISGRQPQFSKECYLIYLK